MGQTVLIVDDEAAIRSLIAITLQNEFGVFPASDAEEALRIARTQDIDLLLTDVQMGTGMNGIELAERMNDEMPGIKTLVISGFPESETLAAEKGLPYLSKPFLPTVLVERVRVMLATKVPAESETKRKQPKQRKMTG